MLTLRHERVFSARVFRPRVKHGPVGEGKESAGETTDGAGIGDRSVGHTPHVIGQWSPTRNVILNFFLLQSIIIAIFISE